MMRLLLLPCAAALLALASLPTLAHADDAAAKVSEINRYLQDLKGRLDPAPRASDVRSAIDIAKKIKASAEKLKGMKPTGDAEKMAKNYPAIVDRFAKAAEQLVAMMTKVEDTGDLAKTCDGAKADLKEAGEKLTRDKNPRTDPAPLFQQQVEKSKEKVDAALADARKRATELEGLKRQVLAFDDQDGGWKWVKERLEKRSTQLDSEYDAALKAAETACAPLSKGLQNPDVVSVLATLKQIWEDGEARRACTWDGLGGEVHKTIEVEGKNPREREAAVKKLASEGSAPNDGDRSKIRQCGCVTDAAGHAIGKALGGSGRFSDGNVFPQDPKTNSGAMMQYEKDLRQILVMYGRLDVTLKFTYDSHSKTRPTEIEYVIEAKAPEDCDDPKDCEHLADFKTSKKFTNPLPSNAASADVCPGYMP